MLESSEALSKARFGALVASVKEAKAIARDAMKPRHGDQMDSKNPVARKRGNARLSVGKAKQAIPVA